MSKKVNVGPQQKVLLECYLNEYTDQLANCRGLVSPNKNLQEKANIALTSSPSQTDNDKKTYVSAIKVSDSQITLNSKTQIAHFEILRESQAEYPIKIDPQLLALAKMRKPDDFANEINQVIQDIHFQNLTMTMVGHHRITQNFGCRLPKHIRTFQVCHR